MISTHNHTTEEYVGTQTAANHLGLSIASVQQMHDRGLLKGYLTPGGHRRISLSSIIAYQNRTAINTEYLSNSSKEHHLIDIFTKDSELINECKNDEELSFVRIITSPVDILNYKNIHQIRFLDYLWLTKYKLINESVNLSDLHNTIIYSKSSRHIRSKNIKKIKLNGNFLKGYSLAIRHLHHPPHP